MLSPEEEQKKREADILESEKYRPLVDHFTLLIERGWLDRAQMHKHFALYTFLVLLSGMLLVIVVVVGAWVGMKVIRHGVITPVPGANIRGTAVN